MFGGVIVVVSGFSGQFKDLFNKVKQVVQFCIGNIGMVSQLFSSDIVVGFKEVFVKGMIYVINMLGCNGGFWNNFKVCILLFGKLEQVGKFVCQLGQGVKVDVFEFSFNCVVEKVVFQVVDIFGDVICKMIFDDVCGIFFGGDYVVIDFFCCVVGDVLVVCIWLIVVQVIDSVGVIQKYKVFILGSGGGVFGDVLGLFGVLGGKFKSDVLKSGYSLLDLDDYVIQKIMDGLFIIIVEQEQLICQNLVVCIIDFFKKVFGGC